MTGRTYLLVFLSLCTVILAPVIGLNLALGARGQGSPEITRLASDWQQATRGVTYSPPIWTNRPFKALRLHDRLPHINAVVFGASSVMGITAGVFPEGIRAYNFSQSGNSLAAALGEAEYVAAHFADRIKWFIVPFDWSIGFLFEKGGPGRIDLAPESVLSAMTAEEIPFHRKLVDALSYPKVANLSAILRDVLRAQDKTKAFHQVFFEVSGDEYRCPDGARAKDFDVLYRGKCGGFYYDGSSTFSAFNRIRPQDVEQRVLAGSLPSSKYSLALQSTRGSPNASHLGRVARLSRDLARSGGKVIVLLPPLIPGLEQRLAAAPHSAGNLARLKQALSGWAGREGIVVIDAGRSERYGCFPLEYLDEHHAMRECYRKLFARFWPDYRRGIAPGLYAFP